MAEQRERGSLGPGALNLNLIRALVALLEQRSVSRAATRLGVTQSAVSHALAQLREAFGDPLLVRCREGMLPTAYAERLVERLGGPVAEIERVIAEGPTFDPATSKRRFVIAAGDHMAAVLLQGVSWHGRSEAPNVDFRVLPFDPERNSAQLERGDIHLAIGSALEDPLNLRQKTVFSDDFACIVGKNHPEVRDSIEVEHLKHLPHVLVCRGEPGFRDVEGALHEHGIYPRVYLDLPYLLLAPALLIDSELVLIAPVMLGVLFGLGFPLRVLKPPIALPRIDQRAYWHERFDRDPDHLWLRSFVWRCIDTFLDRTRSLAVSIVGSWPDSAATPPNLRVT